MSGTTVLLTVLPPSRAPGHVPTGPVGRHLARRLLSEGIRVRVLAPAAEHTGWPDGVELIDGAVTQPAASPSAFRDLDCLCLAGLVAMVPEGLRDLANLALAGGLRRVVVLASHGSDFEDEYSPETWQWLAFEQALRKHGAEWTYLRPVGLFASMLAGGYPITSSSWASQIRRGQELREFMPQAAYPFIDEDDVAAILAAILLHGGHNEKVLDVAGTLSSAAERARGISAAAGSPVRLRELTSPEQARQAWAADGWPDITIDVTLYAMNAFSANAGTTIPVIEQQISRARSLLGRRPNSFADWLAGNVTAFTPAAAPADS
jgi:uncharacterized protein YbjT (DUF2867 family)